MAVDRYAELDLDSTLALLRRAQRIDPGFFPAHFEYQRLLQDAGDEVELRRSYRSRETIGGPLADCLAIAARAPDSYPEAIAAALEIVHQRQPNACTAFFLASAVAARYPLSAWTAAMLRYAEAAVRLAPELGSGWSLLAGALLRGGQDGPADSLIQRALEVVPDARSRIELSMHRASLARMRGDTAGADSLLGLVGAAVAADGRPGLRFHYLWRWSGLVSPERRPALVREAVELARRRRAWPLEWRLSQGSATVYVDVHGDVAAALPLYDRAVRLADSVGRPILQVQAYMKRGRALIKAGQLAGAQRDLERATEFGRRAENDYFLAEVYHNLAHLFESSNRLVEATRAVDRFVEHGTSVPESPLRMMSLRDAGMLR